MAKNIAVFLDGTWNRPDEPDEDVSRETNVRILFEVCVSDNGKKDDKKKQVTYYDEGVGCHWYDRIRGGIFGRGLSKNIREGYHFIAQNYEKGDKVFLFGFSRGAYTARSLGGMIYSCGLLPENKLTEKNIEDAYHIYKNGEWDERKEYKERNGITCPIEMIGVWDTVGALGIPTFFMKKMTDKLLQFHDTKLNREVKAAYHAVAIDEQREKFAPCLWDNTRKHKSQIIEQVWFAGVHSDVGGGYEERHHSDMALKWMAEKAQEQGLLIKKGQYQPKPDLGRPIHDSYKIYFGPKQRRVATASEVNIPKVHRSVIDKISKRADYNPLSLVDIDNKENLSPYEIVD